MLSIVREASRFCNINNNPRRVYERSGFLQTVIYFPCEYHAIKHWKLYLLLYIFIKITNVHGFCSYTLLKSHWWFSNNAPTVIVLRNFVIKTMPQLFIITKTDRWVIWCAVCTLCGQKVHFIIFHVKTLVLKEILIETRTEMFIV